MYKQIIENIKSDLDKAIEFLKAGLNKLRTGRATPLMVEDIEIDCYNQKFPLKQLANISTPQPRLITIQPWDRSILSDIEKGISKSSLGFSPIVDGGLIRINIPPLSEERRRELIKILHEKAEEARISIRHHRERVWKEIQEKAREGEIGEDDKYRGKDELQKLIDNYNEKVTEIEGNKEKEIMIV